MHRIHTSVYIDLALLTPRMRAALAKQYARISALYYHESGRDQAFGGYIYIETFNRWLQEINMPNLFPDMSRTKYEGSEDFIFGAPIHEDAWKKLAELSDCALNTAKSHYFTLPKEAHGADHGITVILRQHFETDDDMLEAATWLRIVKSNRDRIYAVPYYTSIDLTSAMLKTIGAPRHLSVMFEVPTKEKP